MSHVHRNEECQIWTTKVVHKLTNQRTSKVALWKPFYSEFIRLLWENLPPRLLFKRICTLFIFFLFLSFFSLSFTQCKPLTCSKLSFISMYPDFVGKIINYLISLIVIISKCCNQLQIKCRNYLIKANNNFINLQRQLSW